MTPCRYGYGSAEFYGQILNGYGNASIPLETFVSDSQYMDHDQDFTLGYTFPQAQMKASLALQVLPGLAQSALARLFAIKLFLSCSSPHWIPVPQSMSAAALRSASIILALQQT